MNVVNAVGGGISEFCPKVGQDVYNIGATFGERINYINHISIQTNRI